MSAAASYDGYARLTGYTRSGEAALAFGYNGLDDRVSQTRGSTTTRYVYDGDGRVIGEYGASATDVKAEYIWLSPEVANDNVWGGTDGIGGDAPLAVSSAPAGGTASISWIHANHIGAPLLTTSASGTAITPSGYTQIAFPGQLRTLPDLYYNRYRDYDPTTGRYVQADPIGLDGGANPYAYAMNNPMRYVDPLGLETYWEHYTGLPDSYRQNIINGIAGVSDGATFGGTRLIRDLIGSNRDVNSCSPYYEGGEWISLGVGGGRILYAGGSKLLAASAKNGAQAVARRNAIKRIARGPAAASNYRIKSYADLFKKYGTDRAVKAAAGRTNRTVNAVGAALAASGTIAVSDNFDQ